MGMGGGVPGFPGEGCGDRWLLLGGGPGGGGGWEDIAAYVRTELDQRRYATKGHLLVPNEIKLIFKS